MADSITRFFGRTVSSESLDIKLGQGACFLGSVVICLVSMWKLTRLELSDAQFFFGILLSLCVPLLLVIVGMVLPGAVSASRQQT